MFSRARGLASVPTRFVGAAVLLAAASLAGCVGGGAELRADEAAEPALGQAGQALTGTAECVGVNIPDCARVYHCAAPGDLTPAGTRGLVPAPAPSADVCPEGARAAGLTPACTTGPGANYVLTATSQPWLDACSAPGRVVHLADADDAVATVALPFAFRFFNEHRNEVRVASNGIVAFGDAPSLWVNQPLPYDGASDAVFAFWDDLQLRRGGVCTATFGAAPARRFVAQWDDAAFFGPSGDNAHLTFEVVLSERDHAVDVLYRSMNMSGNPDRASGGSASIGFQQGRGVTHEQVGFNTPGTARQNSGFRWTPNPTGGTVCERGTWTRVLDGACTGYPPLYLPVWGRLQYHATVPQGAMIALQVRAADTAAGLATAAPIALPFAPVGLDGASPPIDLGAVLRARAPGMETRRFVEVMATLEGAEDGRALPVLGALEAQRACNPNEYAYDCRGGHACEPPSACRRGTVACSGTVAACAAGELQPAGTPCGSRLVCTAAGACAPCNEGGACSVEGGCGIGRISCASGAPVCVVSLTRPAGTVCGTAPDDYLRSTPIFEWYDACRAPGHTVVLPYADDAVAYADLPFSFRYYGTPHTRVAISTNGFVSFGAGSSRYLNAPLPAWGVSNSVFALWDDLVTRDGVCVATFGAAPRRRFVVQWDDARFHEVSGESTNLEFEVVLSEASQAIDVFYRRLDGFGDRAQGSSATVGIQRADGPQHDMASYNVANVIARNTGFRWVPVLRTRCDAAGRCR